MTTIKNADMLQAGHIVVLDGRIASISSDPEHADHVRVEIVAVLGPPHEAADERVVTLLLPRDMPIGTATLATR